jgi:predicted DNA binding protein
MSCFGQPKDFKLTIYPSSGGELGYVVTVKGLMFEVVSKELIIEGEDIVLGKTKKVEKRELSKCQSSKINNCLKDMESLSGRYQESNLILDVWVFDFIINSKQSLKINSSLLKMEKELTKADKLIKYLKRISPMELKLSDFS